MMTPRTLAALLLLTATIHATPKRQLDHSIPGWTLQTEPQRNANRNPLAQITPRVTREDEQDAERGPQSDRHRACYERGLTPQSFPWVLPEESLQWAAFQRLCDLLVARGGRRVSSPRPTFGAFEGQRVASPRPVA